MDFTFLRHFLSQWWLSQQGVPKSSFLTEEKRARLKTNPVKVHFAEEVLVSGHSQGNSLLCMPNVLKVYLENGQTKAFKFEANTTVKDIILTVKEKLSIRSIEYFALALEEQYSISRLHLLHEEELIQQVVEREESQDSRCLFRVCFVPKDPLDLLKEDPVAFEYLYLQSCSDVLQERFAVEMKCNSALRLAALHIQERIYACAQPQKISLKYIEKDWGIENFISPTLLRNMKGKDIKKAISFHMKRNQNLLEPRQKILGELKTYGGKVFNATLMLQDRESYIALLVGAKYGISQIINSKLNIMSTLAEFANISRVELTEESEKVSVVKVYLQDIKVLTLLLESNSAKDLACLIAGYYRLFVDPASSVFLWSGNRQQIPRVSAEEVDCILEPLSDRRLVKLSLCRPFVREEQPPGDSPIPEVTRRGPSTCGASSMTDSAESEASDSANTESRGCRTSGSSESMDALEEDDLDACSSSGSSFFHFGPPGFSKDLDANSQEEKSRKDSSGFLCLLDLAQNANPQCQKIECPQGLASGACSWGSELSMGRLDPRFYEGSRTDYYSLCSSISPGSHLSDSSESTASAAPRPWCQEGWMEAQPGSMLETLALHPLPSLAFEDGSSDEEYYDAADKLTPPDTLSGPRAVDLNAEKLQSQSRTRSSEESLHPGPEGGEPSRRGGAKKYAKTLRKRRSFLQTDHTSQAGEITRYLPSEDQTLSYSLKESQGKERDIVGPACQEQELLAELDVGPDFLLGEQTIPSAFPLETGKAEQLNHVIGEDMAPVDTPQQVCVQTVPSQPKLSPCKEEPRSADSGHGSPAESKDHSPIICLPPERSFLCFAPESHPEGSTSLSKTTSFGFSSMNEVVPAGIGIEHCRCQLSYATCFRGMQPETEEEDGDPQTHPVAPLTSPPSAGSQVTLPWRPARAYSCTTPLPRKSHIWPEYCSRALRQMKTAPASAPEGFVQLTESLLELQDILEASWEGGNKHPTEKCTWHFSESRSRLCMGSQKLLSSCQHVIRMDQSPEEMQGAVRVTFQHLVQLAGLCFQFTDCSRCSTRHKEVAGNLRDVVYTYHQFVEAAKLTCERGYHDLSVKLLARQYTALTAAVFCLTQKFRASTAL
ncbi:FERM and PDZ domain-containing protein 1 [Cricetulus griseus]|uniref:FERM and PDZ domain-containing protein 1 n=1 Tax=Cricetulus griseus TaxID=10029 RepID=G3HMF4_CRIGR|nr:FERM and PDZ domain-containing protein 1 [Cricetulus griseus]